MEGHCSTGQSPQWAVVPVEEDEVYCRDFLCAYIYVYKFHRLLFTISLKL